MSHYLEYGSFLFQIIKRCHSHQLAPGEESLYMMFLSRFDDEHPSPFADTEQPLPTPGAFTPVAPMALVRPFFYEGFFFFAKN